ncbi:MAG TPA: LCP family protein [Anaerolineales bacterium]|nr:LCP family protein [Anaerolineales bacterium]
MKQLPGFILLIPALVVGCRAGGAAEPAAFVEPPPSFGSPAPIFDILLPADRTATPFLPLPVTGTPPPTSTPVPTPAPTATPTATPWLQPTFAPPSEPVSGIPAPFPLLSPSHTINFVLLGSDSRGGPSFRTDVVMIVMVDLEENGVTLISVPRDLYVYIPGWTMNRINTAFLRGEMSGYPGGGTALIKDTLRYNLGVRIDHVALVDFDGFRRIVDTTGGIDVPLVCPFTEWAVIDPSISIEFESNWELITIGPGVVHMDGDMALWYSRARARSSDFDRGRRQQEVIRALFDAAIDTRMILEIPALFDDFKDTVRSDVSLQTILSLVSFGLNLDEAQIRSFYIGDALTWGWRTPGGASVLLPNSEAIYAMMLEAVGPPGEEPESAGLVEIRNRSGREDWDALAAERLHYAGFETVILDEGGETLAQTTLYDFRGVERDAIAELLLDALGLPESRWHPETGDIGDAAFRLVLGEDYDPCFNPAVP